MKKFKTIITLFLALCLFSGCSKTTASKTVTTEPVVSKEVKKVGFLVPYTSNSFMAMLGEEFKKAFETEGYEYNIAVADGDSKKQIEQVENMVTMKVDALVVMSVDPTGMTDALNKAKSSGIKIIDFTTRTGAGDMFCGADNILTGRTVAENASAWIDKAFPDSAKGTVQVAIMEFRDTPEAAERSDGLKELATMNSKVNIKKVVGVANTTDGARIATENLLLTDPDINVILTYNAGMALGVNAYVMTPSSPIKDKSKFGVFGADSDVEALTNVKISAKDESVLRGLTILGGDIKLTIQNVVGYTNKLINGEKVADDIAPVIKITPENVDEYLTK